jgi:hypothetical protein
MTVRFNETKFEVCLPKTLPHKEYPAIPWAEQSRTDLNYFTTSFNASKNFSKNLINRICSGYKTSRLTLTLK